MQYFWPPQDPSRLPDPPRPDPSASAFIYGNDSFNPALRPSNVTRRRHPDQAQADTQGEMGYMIQGEDGDEELGGWVTPSSRGSSPERYLSDYDDENWGPRTAEEEQEERLRRLEGKVRRGSEGWEVRPAMASWNRPPPPVWLEQGRYNVYDPRENGAVEDSDEE